MAPRLAATLVALLGYSGPVPYGGGMNVTALAVGFGVLCFLPVGSTTQVAAQKFGAPAFVIAGGYADTQTAFELLHSIDVPFTMDGPQWQLIPEHKTLVIVPGHGGDESDGSDALVDRIRMLIAQALENEGLRAVAACRWAPKPGCEKREGLRGSPRGGCCRPHRRHR